MKKKITSTCVLSNLYFWGSLIGICLLFTDYNLGVHFLFAGAFSTYVSFVFMLVETNLVITLICLIWTLCYPLLLLISYVFAIKKRYKPMAYVMIADCVFIFFWTVSNIITKNYYSITFSIADLFVSIALVCLYMMLYRKHTHISFQI